MIWTRILMDMSLTILLGLHNVLEGNITRQKTLLSCKIGNSGVITISSLCSLLTLF